MEDGGAQRPDSTPEEIAGTDKSGKPIGLQPAVFL